VKIVLLGAQGSGKGTQAKYLVEEFKIPHISTGDLFRQNVANKTPLGLRVQEALNSGALISDDLTVEMLIERLKEPDTKNGYILDGFPRTVNQAQLLHRALALLDTPNPKPVRATIALEIKIDDDLAIKRILGRYNCVKCGKNYNTQLGPVDKCTCGAALEQRADDTEAAIRHRLAQYRSHEKAILEYCREQGVLVTIHAKENDKPEQIYQSIKLALNTRGLI